MKKLMVAIAAVAVSAFAWAEGGAYEADSVEDGLTKWTESAGDSAQGDYEADGVAKYGYPTTTRYGGFGDDAKYLKVKNSLGKESIDLAFDSVAVADSVCFDTLVNFTNGCEDDITELPDGSKLAVWLKELAAEDDEANGVGETNLYVRAGFYDGQAYVEKNFQIPNSGVEPGSWHRVTVSTIANVLANGDNKLPGFVVYLDGVLVAHNDPDKIGRTGLDTVAAAYNNNNNLFISAVGEEEAPTISALGFSGTGLADDASIVYGDAIPAFAKAATLTITADQGVTGFKYSIGGAAPVTVVGSTATPQIQVGQTVVLTDITVANSETAARSVEQDLTKWSKTNLTVSDDGFEFVGGASAALTIKVVETAFEVVLRDAEGKFLQGGTAAEILTWLNTEDGKKFVGNVNFLRAYNDLSSGTTIPKDSVLNIANGGVWTFNVAASKMLIFNDIIENGKTVVINGDVTLSGTIKGADPDVETTVTVNGGCYIGEYGLTVGDGSNGLGAALIIGADGTFEAGESDGKITLGLNGRVVVPEAVTVDDVFAKAPTGKKIVLATVTGGVEYKLTDLATVLVTVENTGAIVTGVESGDYTEGTNVTFTVAPAEGYKTPITVTGAESTGTDGEYTFTVGTTPITITVTATAKEIYTVTFKTNNCEVAFATKQVTEGEKLGDFATPADIPGYTGAWDPTAPTADDVINANTTYNYTYTADTYTITYMCDDGVTPFTQFKQSATIPNSYTVAEVVTLPGADAIEEAFGGTWEAWTNANGVAVTDTTGLMGNLMVFAQIKQQGSPGADVVKNSVDGADDITDPDQKAALEVNATALSTTLGGPDKVAEWAANVYTSGKIPAAKLATTDEDVIALAVANDLPITENEPTFTVAEGVVENDGVAAFVFTLEDGEDSVAIEKMTAKVKAMVKYTGDLTDDFDAATEDEVAVGLNAAGAITAELKKQDDVNAGFMKVEPNQPTK